MECNIKTHLNKIKENTLYNYEDKYTPHSTPITLPLCVASQWTHSILCSFFFLINGGVRMIIIRGCHINLSRLPNKPIRVHNSQCVGPWHSNDDEK